MHLPIWPSYGIGARLDVGRRLPFVVGAGIPIFPKWVDKNERATRRDTVFFSMAGTF